MDGRGVDLDEVTEIDYVPAGGTAARRPRHRVALLSGGVLAVLALTATVLLSRDTAPDDVTMAESDVEATTTTAKPQPTSTSTTETTAPTAAPVVDPSTTVPTTAPPPVAPATTAPRRTPTTAAPTTTTAPPPPGPVCRNSYDPACGPFYWDPAPANQPLTASFVDMPARWNLAVDGGLPVRFQWADPDASLTYHVFSFDGSPVERGSCAFDPPRYWPWTPRGDSVPGAGTSLAGYAYFPGPGTYTLVLAVGTAGCGWVEKSDVVIQTTIEVVYEPPPPSSE